MYNKNNVVLSKNLRKNMTPWERKLWYEFLRDYPHKFYRQRPIGEYIVDFYCSAAKLVIELDGGGHYTEEKKEKDKKRNEYLNDCGIEVMRIANNELDDNFYGICTAINNKIEEIMNPR